MHSSNVGQIVKKNMHFNPLDESFQTHQFPPACDVLFLSYSRLNVLSWVFQAKSEGQSSAVKVFTLCLHKSILVRILQSAVILNRRNELFQTHISAPGCDAWKA